MIKNFEFNTYTMIKQDFSRNRNITEVRISIPTINSMEREEEKYLYIIKVAHDGYDVHVFEAAKHVFIRNTKYKNIVELTVRLKEMYNRGRVLMKVNDLEYVMYGPIHPYKSGKLTWKQTRALLTFERKANKDADLLHESIRFVEPTVIPGYLDMGDYIIEAWRMPDQVYYYSYVADNETTANWIEKVIK
jgi:hypothetical protein